VRSALLVLLCACGSKEEPPIVIDITGSASASDVVKGSITVDGSPVTLGACKPGHSTRPFVELVTSKGKLRFENQILYWNANPDAITRGAELACTKLDRSWGGGVRMPGDGTSYWRGKLWFTCGAVAGELELDCGNITAEERRQLDGKREGLLDEQRGSGKP
jgi:hypothetical protein